MRLTRLYAVLALPLALAACAGNELSVNSPTLPDAPLCGATEFKHLIGQSQSALQGINASGPVRIMGPNSVVTMDYRGDRLNALVDRSGTITALSCG